MTFHWPTVLRETAEQLVKMAAIPGAQEHAVHRRDELLADPMFEGLREEIQRVRQEGGAK